MGAMVSLDTYRLVEYPEVLPMMDRLLASMNEQGTEQDVKTAADAFTYAGNWLLNIDGPMVVSRMPFFEIILK